jgi:formyltetrahydrofolate hydrolase
VPFHHIPFPALNDPHRKAGRLEAFDKIRALVAGHDPDAIVLARFMQVLPTHLCEEWGPVERSISTTASCRRSSGQGRTTRRTRAG